MLGNVYMKSNEISFKVKAPQNAPALESREKNGKSSNRGSKTLALSFEANNHDTCDKNNHFQCSISDNMKNEKSPLVLEAPNDENNS
jgi:hypothetical protein